jgi:glutaredoxin-related protein
MINIFYLSYCPYSQRALEILEHYNITHNKIESSSIKSERKKFYPTFPQIYWKDNLLGGKDNFEKIINTLQKNKIPSTPDQWTKRKWYIFLLNLIEKL